MLYIPVLQKLQYSSVIVSVMNWTGWLGSFTRVIKGHTVSFTCKKMRCISLESYTYSKILMIIRHTRDQVNATSHPIYIHEVGYVRHKKNMKRERDESENAFFSTIVHKVGSCVPLLHCGRVGFRSAGR